MRALIGGLSFEEYFGGILGGHVEQNSVCRDTNAVDERNQPHLVFWLYFITFLQYFPLFFSDFSSVPGGACPVGYCVPFGWSGLSGASGAQRPVGRPTRRGPRFSRNGGKEPGPSVIDRRFRRNRRRGVPCHVGSARSRAGDQAFSRESPDARSRGEAPPPFYGPLVSTRSFWCGGAQRGGGKAISSSSTCPDLGAFFLGFLLEHRQKQHL